jgi:broad specificity phosphatase PhoE
MAMRECDWCGAELGGLYLSGLPVSNWWLYDPDMGYYCSARCFTERRADLFRRDKQGREKWVRYSADIPPELAAMIDAAAKKSLGVNVSAFSHANVVRAALRLYLDKYAPVADPSIDATATDDAPLELAVRAGG